MTQGDQDKLVLSHFAALGVAERTCERAINSKESAQTRHALCLVRRWIGLADRSFALLLPSGHDLDVVFRTRLAALSVRVPAISTTRDALRDC